MAETFLDNPEHLIIRLGFKLTESRILQPVLKNPDYVSVYLSNATNYSDY